MLGVLAVIGVLSVAGIAGYQFAMNKYRANQIANELNLVSNQIMFTLLKTHREDFELTLVSPFDEDTLPSGFPFTYGCGTDTTMTGCFADDTTYYETLSGLPEDLCKTVAQLTQNLSYLVEQRVNDTVDTMGTSCSGDNNELVLLFEVDQYNSDDSTGGSGSPNDDLPTGGVSPDDWPFLPVSGTLCTQDEDCTGDFVACYHGLCVRCLTDLDCHEGMYCYRGGCRDNKPECIKDADCSEGEYCDEYYGECRSGNANRCNSDSDCSASSPYPYCDVYGRCSGDECVYDMDCQFLGKGKVCSQNKCYAEGCKSDADCQARDSRYPYCHAGGACSSSECYSDEDCPSSKGTVCSNYKCYAEGCKSDSECQARDSRYPYCHADGQCNSSECFSNEDCSVMGKGKVCSRNKCYEEGCKSDADCPMSGQSATYKYCHADGSCSYRECSSNEDCSAMGKGTICIGRKCYAEGCKDDTDCPRGNQSSSYKYCRADGTCSSSECYSNEDCPSSKGTVCSNYKCYDRCKSDADCPMSGQSTSYKYCHADGQCSSSECSSDTDCSAMGKGSQCIGNECLEACKSDADCEAISSYLRFCLSNGVCHYSECRTNSECQTLNKGTKCVYDNIDYVYRCQE